MNLNRKQKIEKYFGSKVSSYNQHASLQKFTAQKLCALLPNAAPLKILEIGCGTGFLTEELQKKYPQSKILAIDISKEMVSVCAQKFIKYQNISFDIADGEGFLSTEKFDLIVSNLSIQWFENPIMGLYHLTSLLKSDGVLFYTTIGKEGFHEWKDVLNNLNLSSGLLDSPSYKGIFQEEKNVVNYKNALDFLSSFKKIGAQQPRPNYIPLKPVELIKACKSHDGKYKGQITWHILYGALDSSGRALYR